MQKEGDSGDAVSAFSPSCSNFGFARNFLHNFCTILTFFLQTFAHFCIFLHVFAHLMNAVLVLIFQTQSCVSAIFQKNCNSARGLGR